MGSITVKQFTLAHGFLEIKYVGLGIKRSYKISEISKITFYSSDTAYDPAVIKIEVGGKKFKYYFFSEKVAHQKLINLLREIGVEVEVFSVDWK